MKFPVPVSLLMTLLLNFIPAGAQFYLTGEPPSSIRWMQLKTPQFTVVYPDGLWKDAARLIIELEKTSAQIAQPFAHPAKHLPILLHSSSVLSNGYVTWAPGRMELVTTPPQDSYAQDWISQLAVHEYRHVEQISQLRQGFTSAMSILLGEIAPGGVAALLPSWMYEGDAVVSETLNSEAGRGRVPRFEMPLRTMLLEKNRIYSYDKAILGSYRDFIPDQYQYGYPMVSFGMAKYDQRLWPGVLNYTAMNPYLLIPLSFYLNRNYHTNRSGLYRSALDSVKSLYVRKEELITYSKYSSIVRRNDRVFTSYKLPLDGGHEIVALKTGIGVRDCFVEIDSSGKEKKLITPGRVLGLKSDMHGSCLVWDEIVSDPRWGRRDYSEIRLFDLKSGKLRNLTKRTRYFSPDFSPNGKAIAVAETDVSDNNFLTLLDTQTGRCIRRIASPGNKALQFPEWLSGSQLAVITVSHKGKQLEKVDLNSGKWSVLLSCTRFDVSEPLHFRNYLLFRCSYNGIENIYALDMSRQNIYQVTFSRFGAFNPSLSGDSAHILFADYSVNGFNITRGSLDTVVWKMIVVPPGPAGIWPGTRSEDIPPAGVSESEPAPPSDIGPYRKAAHLFHFHSWLPFYTPLTSYTSQISNLPINAGFMLFSQNLLGTLTSSIGYHFSNGFHYLTPRITWKGWYPVFELSGQVGGPVRTLPLPEHMRLPDNLKPYYEYRILAYVPLTYNRGSIIWYLTPEMEYEYTSTYYYSGENLRQGLNYMHFRLYMSRFLRLSSRDLYTRWGQYIQATYTGTPGDPGLLGSLYSIQAGLYLPGAGPHHHILIKGGYQKQLPQYYYLPINRIDFPRGYASAVSGVISTFSVDYAFPVAYPDLSLGPVLYVKRLRVDLFHDYSYGRNIFEGGSGRFNGSYRSTGIEILADFHLARSIFPISAGIREGYLYNGNRYFAEFLLNIKTGSL